jgi:peptidoglycan/LPS O-acetylase OafA/YrhL
VDAVDSPYFYLLNFLNIFFKYGTPSFIMLSSFVLFYNYYERPLTRELITGFYKKRLLYILVPYVVFSVIYFVLRIYMNGYLTISSAGVFLDNPAARIQDFFVRLATGKNYTHLYFVFISVQFYVLFPVFLYLFKKLSWLARWAIPVGFGLQWAFVLVNHYTYLTSSPGSLAISYMAYYFLGAYLAIHYDLLKGWLESFFTDQTVRQRWATAALWGSWLIMGLLHVQMYYVVRKYGFNYDTVFPWLTKIGLRLNTLLPELLWNVHTILTALLLMQASAWIYKWAWQWVVKLLGYIGMLSFAIYLIHPLWLAFYRKFSWFTPFGINPLLFNPNGAAYVVWIYGGLITALIASSIGIILSYKVTPLAWVAFGNTPYFLKRRKQVKVSKRGSGK